MYLQHSYTSQHSDCYSPSGGALTNTCKGAAGGGVKQLGYSHGSIVEAIGGGALESIHCDRNFGFGQGNLPAKGIHGAACLGQQPLSYSLLHMGTAANIHHMWSVTACRLIAAFLRCIRLGMLCWVCIWLLGVLGISSIRSSSPSGAELTDGYINLLHCVPCEHRYDALADTESLLDAEQNILQGWEGAAQIISAAVRDTCTTWPSLKLSEAPSSSKCKTVRTKARTRAVAAVGDQERPQEAASSSKRVAAKMKTKPVVAPVKKTVLGMMPKAKPAAAVQSTVEVDDDSYEYYTSTSESQDIVQMPLQKPDSRARAEYIAGCIILLSAWFAVDGAMRLAGWAYVQYCLVQVFPGIARSATQSASIVRGLRVWFLRAIKGAYKLTLQRKAAGTCSDELFITWELLVAALCCLLRQVRRRLGGRLRYQQNRPDLGPTWVSLHMLRGKCQALLIWLCNRLERERHTRRGCWYKRSRSMRVSARRGREHKSRQGKLDKSGDRRGTWCNSRLIQSMMYVTCALQSAGMAHGMGVANVADTQELNEPVASNLLVAAPVPNPEVETRDEHRQFATHPGRGRSEGWESCQAPGNGVKSGDEVPNHPVKNGREGRQEGTSFSRIRKRAYKRALNRASRGPTMYRGQQVTWRDLRGQYVGRRDLPAKQRSSAPQSLQGLQTATMSITCLTWNCGGLSNLRDEFFTWLEGKGYDVVFLQETWYTQSLEYTTRGWHCVCSGVGGDSKRAHAGVMTLLRASVFQQEYIRHHEHIPGRVLQVRAFCHGGWIDTLNLYQHVLGDQQQEEVIVQKRMQVWQKVRAVLGQIPRGHKLVVAGDLNCNLAPVTTCTGTGMMIPATASQELVALLQDFQLRAVNTYGRRGNCTYIHEGYKPARKSFIDYILVRQTGLGRHSTGIIRDWQVARWRQGGRHMPVWTSLSISRYKAHKETIQSPWPNWKCKLLVQAIQEQPHLARQCRERITQALQQAGEYDPKKLNDILLQAGQDIFRIRRPAAGAPPWEEAEYVGQIKIMWGHYRSMRQEGMLEHTQRRTLGSIFSCWRHFTCFQQMRKTLQRRSRSMRRIRLAVLTREADSQNRAGCMQAIFDLLRKVAPKQPRRRAQLRTKDGKLMSPAEEAEALCHFWMEVNGGPPPRQVTELGSFDVSKDEVIEALQQLRVNKSAPQHCAPHALWRLAAEPIASYMESCVFGRWREGPSSIPADWAAAWLVFLSKPGKTNCDPKSLRPIALLDPMGKAICGVLKQRLVPFLMRKARFLPLFGYIQQRSPQQALELVFAHCAEARAMAKAQTRSLYERRMGHTRSQCSGGMQISIDFSQAFDRADRRLLVEALEFLAVPEDLRDLILRWVQATTFHISKADAQYSYSSVRGIRQGCKLSPTLWCCLFTYILHRLDQTLGQCWSQQHLVGFADDLHLRWLFSDRAGINKALGEAGCALSLLEDMGFCLSRDKTVCLLRAEGVQVPHMLRKLVRKKNKHTDKQLCIDTRWQLPLRKQHVYLGAVISYGAFEVQNAQHRKHAGQAAFARMRPTLMSQRALSLDKRLRLWRTIVVPTTMYSLGASGLTKQAYDLIRVMFVKQIRAIARSPRHLTEESDNSLLSRLGMPTPYMLVMQQQQNTLAATQRILQEGGGEDFRAHPIIVQRELQLLEMVQALDRPSAADQDATHKCQCDMCDKAFENEAALRSHKAKMHSAERRSAEPTVFDRQRHGTDGMPQCSGCGHAFERWADLQKHIEENHCQGKPPSEVPQDKSVFV